MAMFKPNIEKLEKKKDIKGLIKALENKDSSVRWRAAEALGKTRDGRAVEPLFKYLNMPGWIHSRTVNEAIRMIGKSALIPLTQILLKDKNFEHRRDATRFLGYTQDKMAVDPLIQALKDEYWQVRSAATEALGRVKDERVMDTLIQALKDKDYRVRLNAAEVLGKIGDERAKKPLIQALKDKDYSVRLHSAEALGKVGGEGVVEQLIQALKDKNIYVRYKVAEILRGWGGYPGREPLAQVPKDEELAFRKEAAKALGKIKVMRVVNNGDDTVTDNATGLMWQKEDDGKQRDYNEAFEYCESLDLGGYDDWRLPNKEELMKLAESGYENLKQDFPNIKAERYWAKTSHQELHWAQNPNKIAYTIDFDPTSSNYGDDNTYFRSNKFYVRAVRSA